MTVSGSKVTLALTSAVGVGDNVRVSYVKPTTNKLTDAIGNEAAALANQTVTNGSARPTLTITGPTTETKDPFTVTFTFNKAVTGFVAADVTVTRGSKGAFTETTAAKVWTLVITPAAGEDDNDVEVSVAQDAATNNGVGNAAASADFDVDTRPPALSTAAVNGNALVLTYDETLGANTPVTSAYTVEQRAGSSGPWSAVTVSTVTVSGSKVTLALTSAVGVGDNVRVSYVKPTTNKLTDAIGNEAAALANRAVTNGSARPTLTITGPTTETKDPFTVTFTFNKAVTGFVAADVTVTRGSKGAFTETTAAKVWTLVITPAAGEDDNDVEVSVAQDAATNNGVGNAAASADFDVDTRPPALSTAAVDGNSLVLTYDETLGANTPVTSAYTVEQRAGSSGPWSAVTVSTVTVSGSKVTLALTSAVGVGDNVRVSYVKPTTNKLTDAIGNEAAALANRAVTNGSARPTLTITGPTTETKDPFTVTFTFNKVVTGFTASDVAVTRGGKGAFSETTAAKVWTLVVTPAAGEDDNDVEVSVAQDAATNNGVGNAAASADFDVDTKPPALSTAAVNGNALVLTYDETLGSNTPVTSAYTVEQRAGSSGPWSAVTVDTVTVNATAKTVTLALTSAVGVGNNVRVSYAKPTTNRLTDAIGNEAAALSNQAVSNNTAAPAGPTFNGANIPDQIWYLNTDIGMVQLPAATGGKAPLTYTLNSDLPEGVTFDNDRRQITGAPTEMRDPEDHTYRVTDDNGNSASIRFKIIIHAQNPQGEDPGTTNYLNLTAIPCDGCVILAWNTTPVRPEDANEPWAVNGVPRHNWLASLVWANSLGSWPFPEYPVLRGGRWTVTIPGLTNGKTYTARVRPCMAKCADNDNRAHIVVGPVSNAVPFTPFAGPPPTPAGVRVTPGDGQVTLHWDAIHGATGWEFEQRIDGGNYGGSREISNPTVTHWGGSVGGRRPPLEYSHTITGLDNDTTYFFKIRMVNGSLDGPLSGEVSATPRNFPPPPGNVRATPGDRQVSLTWDVVAGASGYQWRYFGDWRDVPGDGNATTVIATWLANNVVHPFQVRSLKTTAQGLVIPSGASERVYATPSTNTTLPAPNLSVENGRDHVVLRWEYHRYNRNQPLAGATGYEYRMRPDGGSYPDDASGGGWTSVGDIFGPPFRTTHRVTGLDAGAQYYFQLRAMNATFPGQASVEVPRNADGVQGQIVDGAGAQASLEVTPNPVEEGSPVTVKVTLSQALADAVSVPITVTRDTSDDGDHGTLSSITVAGGATTASLGLATHQDADGDDETFTVAIDTANLPSTLTAGSVTSVTVTITDTTATETPTTPPVVFPNAPTGLSAEAGDQQVKLTWNAYFGAFGWEYSSDGGSTWNTATGAGNDATTYTVTGLDNGAQYTFKIRAVGVVAAITSAASDSVTATPTAPAQSASVSLSADSSVDEGQEATVTATLAAALGSDVDIPLTLSNNTAESDDYGTLASISITAGQTTGAGKIAANWDADTEADTFTVALDGDNLPSSVTAGSPNSASITIQEVPAPDAVASVTVTHNGDSLTVSWPAAARATGYDVTYTNTNDETTGRGAWDHTGASLEITCDSRPDYQNQNCVVGSAAYTVGVRAKNANGASGWVNSAPARPPVPAPTGLSVSESGGDVTLSWNSVSIATSYQYKHTTGGVTTGPTAVPVAGTTLMLSGLDLTKAHTFQVYALWYDTWSDASMAATLLAQGQQAQGQQAQGQQAQGQQAQGQQAQGQQAQGQQAQGQQAQGQQAQGQQAQGQETQGQETQGQETQGQESANAAPAFTSSATFSVNENGTAVGTVVAADGDSEDSVSGYAVTGGADKDKFAITNAGVLTFQAPPDFENPTDVASASPANEAANNQYVLVVTATGGTDSRVLTATQTITVTVENANDPATGAPSISGAALVPGTLTAVTSGIADQDGLTAPGYNYQWLRVDGDSETNIGANSDAYTLAADDQGKTVKVRVSFTDDAGNAETLTSAASGTIALPPAPTGLEVSESGGVVTLSWDSVEVATGYQYQYTTGGVTSVFILVPVDGTSFTISDLDLTKAHTFQVYTLYYDVRSGPSAAATLDPPQEAPQAVNAAPAFASAATFSVNENGTAAGTVVAADGDSEDSVSGYAVTGGADKDKFAITNAGALTFTTAPNFESPTDAASATPANDAANNQYVVTVRATSGTGTRLLTADQTIVVTVADANDPPTGKPAISGAEKVGETLTAGTSGINDEDGLTGSPSWTYQWQRVDGGTATDISGATGSTYVLADDDVGKKLRVTVSFTDDNANNHSLTSDDTAAIGAADGAG